MFTDEFYKMTAADQNNFAEVCNKLLLKGFIVRDIFDNKEKMMRVNPDYRFLERFFEVFESYLKFSGWRIEKDNILFINLYKDIERKEKENEEAQNNLYKKLIKS